MRIIFMGAGVFGEPALRWLAQSAYEVPLVVTQPAWASGRGRRVVRTPIGAVAEALGIEVYDAENINDAASIEKLRSVGAHVGLAIAYGQKLSDELLATTPAGYINLHASILPNYRGAAPINWAVVRGEQRSGCTVFRIVKRMDAGPVLVTHETDIAPQETAGELHDRLSLSGVEAVKEALALHEGGVVPEGTAQDESAATLAPKLKKTDGVIDFAKPANAVAAHICGMTPWPGATARFESQEGRWENVTILRAKAVENAPTQVGRALPDVGESEEDPSGDVEPASSGNASGSARPTSGRAAASGGILGLTPGTVDVRGFIAAAEGYVEILEIKPSSGRVMSWSDYVNGRHVIAGDSFVCPNESA